MVASWVQGVRLLAIYDDTGLETLADDLTALLLGCTGAIHDLFARVKPVEGLLRVLAPGSVVPAGLRVIVFLPFIDHIRLVFAASPLGLPYFL